MSLTFMFELDGTLNDTQGIRDYDRDLFYTFKPRKEIINILKSIKKRGGKIIISTKKRPGIESHITIKWLKKHKIPYDHIVFGSFHVDYYINENAANIKTLLKSFDSLWSDTN